MKDLTKVETDELVGGASSCVTQIAFGASFGGLFGGGGALLGAAIAATGPACLGLW